MSNPPTPIESHPNKHPENYALENRPRIARQRSISPASTARIKVKNRRKRYLDTHPTYLSSPSLELADPLAYDRLIRRFQTPAEREAEGRKKGYSGTLEADLWRSEAKLQALANSPNKRDEAGKIVAETEDEVPASKEEGMERWRREMEMRFLKGEDAEFEYVAVDESEQFDDRGTEEREEEEKWFEEEEPSWAEGSEEEVSTEKNLRGQTGVQDF